MPPLTPPPLPFFLSHSQFGSHTLEALLQRLAALARGDDDDAASAGDALALVTRTAAAAWHPLATHCSGSHVLRALCCALAGRDVAPRSGGAPASSAADGAAFLRDAKRAAKPGAAPAGMAARVTVDEGGGGGGVAAEHAALVADLAAPLLSEEWEGHLPSLARDTYGGPAVQALLRAAAGDE